MIASGIVIACFVCAMIPAFLFVVNLCFFCEPTAALPNPKPRVDVMIPARDEAANIEAVISSVLSSESVDVTIYVYDDNSADETAMLAELIAAADERVHLLRGVALPERWNGKQHACWQLAQAGSAPLMLFLDADVRLEPKAIAHCVAQQRLADVPLLSGFPRIVMETWMEWLLLPLIQFVLMGLLPMFRMRQTTKPAYAAGCGQFMLVEREAYFACGGHAAIKQTRHDGLKLPRLFREHRLRTDICDLTRLAHVRMYRSAEEVWNGLAKNSTEGLGSPERIVPISFLLFVGQVLPTLLVVLSAFEILALLVLAGTHFAFHAKASASLLMFFSALIASYLPGFIAFWKFRHPLRSALLHPLGILMLLFLQWYALVRQVIGKPVGWRARSYSSTSGEQVG